MHREDKIVFVRVLLLTVFMLTMLFVVLVLQLAMP